MKNKVFAIDISRCRDMRVKDKIIRTGVEEFSYRTVVDLIKLLEKNNFNILLYTPFVQDDLPSKYQKIIKAKKFWTLSKLSNVLKNDKPDYFFSTANYLPKFSPPNSFVIIHDIIFKKNPQKYSIKDKLNQEFALWNNLKRAKTIFTVSNYSKNQLLKYTNIKENNIIVINPGYKSDLKQDSKIKRKKILLNIGRVDAKKSLPVLIEAFSKLYKKDQEWRLILAGKPGFGYNNIIDDIKLHDLEMVISLPGYVDENKKNELLNTASFYVHVNSDEGSCLPLLEAWDHSLPTIVPQSEVFYEFGDSSVKFFNDQDPESLYKSLIELINDDKEKDLLIANSQKRLLEYSWNKSAKIIFNTITKL